MARHGQHSDRQRAPTDRDRGPSHPDARLHRALQLQRTAGNRRVATLARRTTGEYDPLHNEIQVAEGLAQRGELVGVGDSIKVALTKGDNRLRAAQLRQLRAIDAILTRPGLKRQTVVALPSARERDAMLDRQLVLGAISEKKSVKWGLVAAEERARTPQAREQIALVRQDIKIVQDEFRERATDNAYRLLDSSERRITSMLGSYGLVTAAADDILRKVAWGVGDTETHIDEWLERAQKGQKASYEAVPAARHRADVATQITQLRNLQKRVVTLQMAYVKRFNEVPLDAHERKEEDRRDAAMRKMAEDLGWGTPEKLKAERRSAEAEINKASDELSVAWINAEREHPVLTAHRDGRQSHLEWIDLGSYHGDPGSLPGQTAKIYTSIRVAAGRLEKASGRDEHQRAAIRQGIRKLLNIQRARAALKQGKVSALKLGPVVDFTKKQLLIQPRSAWAVAVDAVVTPELSVAEEGFEFVKDIFNFAVLVLGAVPGPIGTAASLYDVASGLYTSFDEYVRSTVLSSFSNTDLDRARSLSTVEPSMTGLIWAMIGAGLAAWQIASAVRKGSAARRRALAGDESAWDELDELGRPYGLSLGDDVAAGAQRRRPLLPLRDPEVALDADVVRYTRSSTMREGLAAELRGLTHGTTNVNPEMAWVRQALQSADVPGTSTNWQLLKVLEPYYATIRDPDAIADFAAHIWDYAARRRITPRKALEEIASGAISPTQVRGSLERYHLLRDPPFVDLGFDPGDPHGRWTHLFQEALISHRHGPGAGRRFRHLIARSTGPDGHRGREFWANVWDAVFDDETKGRHINRPEHLGPALLRHLGLAL